jgi:DNA-binding XRE family transcriptional regulator
MPKNFKELYNRMPETSRKRVEERVRITRHEMALEEMRRARSLTQTAIAEHLGIDQGAVSKIEKRTDMYLSTLRNYVEAMGGKLELRAVFPEETVDLDLAAK